MQGKTIDSHLQNSEKIHINGIANGVHDEEFKKEIVEMKAQLDVLMELLQNQKHGWLMKRTARWLIKQLIARG